MEVFFEKLFDIFSLEYMFSVIIASYLVIKLVDVINGEKVVPTWMKRVITFIVGVILFVVFMKFTDETVQCLMASFFSAVFVYDTAIKVIIRKFNIDYRK
jgi:hypothetical protein